MEKVCSRLRILKAMNVEEAAPKSFTLLPTPVGKAHSDNHSTIVDVQRRNIDVLGHICSGTEVESGPWDCNEINTMLTPHAGLPSMPIKAGINQMRMDSSAGKCAGAQRPNLSISCLNSLPGTSSICARHVPVEESETLPKRPLTSAITKRRLPSGTNL